MDLGKIIKHLRQQHGFKQNELATLCSITPAYLSQIEGNHKEPNLATIRVIAENLKVPLPILFFLAMDASDVSTEKKAIYEMLAPSLRSIVGELVTESSHEND
ncbi:MAG: helix-turn-helix domain-containing protein [Bacteroidetes bacterium]|nr:helix-turn-helix domain-containing protein [Bacteroidota bacterium]